jgi:hypothetical protein
MKQPFSRGDSDFFNDLEFKSYIKSAFGDVFTRGIGDSQSTVKHYENTSKWYDIQKEGFD